MASILSRQINLRQTASDTYTASWHVDWTVATALHGGTVAAMFHEAATIHLLNDPTLKPTNQPDVLKLHLEFLLPCRRYDSTITVSILRTGATSSTLQLSLSQKGQLKVLAIATSINFDRDLGPSAKSDWELLPPSMPTPDFAAVAAGRPEPNWVPARLAGEILPYSSRLLNLWPRGGHTTNNVFDTWYRFDGDERMDAPYLALMADSIPAMSDTMRHTGGLYDANANLATAEAWAARHPGTEARIENTYERVKKSTTTFSSTVTLDVEYKRRVPGEGLGWLFIRAMTRSLEKGRMDVDVTLMSESGELMVTAQQTILVLEAGRKFRESGVAGGGEESKI